MTRPPRWAVGCLMIGVGLMAGSFQGAFPDTFPAGCALAANIKFFAGFIIGLLTPFIFKPEGKP